MRDPLASFERIPCIAVKTGVPFSLLTSWRVGGPAKYLMYIQNKGALVEAISAIRELDLPVFLLGSGTNILVSDRGFDGVVLKLTDEFIRLAVDGTEIAVGSGASLGSVVHAAGDASISGLEFALGIPGTVGGAVIMNAGAYGGTTAHALQRVETVTPSGEQRSYESFQDNYRSALVPAGEIVTGATFKLKAAPPQDILQEMETIRRRRKETQPWGQKTAGSVFKNPAGDYAGRLIEECGMKGVSVGPARVSTVHANFIINEGGASASDIKELIQRVSNEVRDRFALELETEVQMIGFEEE